MRPSTAPRELGEEKTHECEQLFQIAVAERNDLREKRIQIPERREQSAKFLLLLLIQRVEAGNGRVQQSIHRRVVSGRLVRLGFEKDLAELLHFLRVIDLQAIQFALQLIELRWLALLACQCLLV